MQTIIGLSLLVVLAFAEIYIETFMDDSANSPDVIEIEAIMPSVEVDERDIIDENGYKETSPF